MSQVRWRHRCRDLLERYPADREPERALSAAMTRLAACLCTGDLDVAAAAAGRAEMLLNKVPAGKLARHAAVRARVLPWRGTIELWSGRLDEAARVLHAGAAAMAVHGGQDERADCIGHLALVEALRGRLGPPRAWPPGREQAPRRPAALAGLAWVHLERYELPRHSWLGQAEVIIQAVP